jgi:ABC-type transporter Mla subunit MlaD
MELIKHFTQTKVEPAPASSSPMRATTPQPLPAHLIEGNGNEPRIYSVRKMLENLPPDAIPAAQSSAQVGDPADLQATERNPDLAGAVLSYVETGGGAEYQVFQAVARLFDQTAAARAHLNDLGSMFDSIETLAQTVAGTFVPLDAFRQQLEQLARTFVPIKALRQEMARIAQTCDAIKPLQDQFTQLTSGFNLHITALIKALEPAEEVRLRIVQLAEAFEPLTTLHERLAELQGAFDGGANGSGTTEEHANGSNGDSASGSAVTFFVAKSA